MREIARIPHNGLNVVSTFAGCGGSSLGYRMAGFRVLFASEFVEAARDTYKANARKGTIVDDRDIRELDPLEVLRALDLKVGELDVLDGSPPCASFSTAGKREKHWGAEKAYSDKRQRTDDLFFEYVRFVRAMQPRVFVAENVSGLVKGVAKGYFIEILKELKGCGYRVEARLLDAQWLGVPQQRQRIIFVGVRNDLDLEPSFPAPLPYRYSVRDALPDLLVTQGRQGDFRKLGQDLTNRPCKTILGTQPMQFDVQTKKGRRSGDLPAPTIMQHGRRGTQSEMTLSVADPNYRKKNPTAKEPYRKIDLTSQPCLTVTATGLRGSGMGEHWIEPETDIKGQAIGREYDRLNPGEASDKYFNLVRSDAAAPAPTITASGGMNSGIACAVHPTEKRKFAIAELKRICSFPDSFILTGTYAQQWERLGRAVPPMMMFHIATAVRGILECADRQAKGSGRKSIDARRISAGHGKARRPVEATVISGSTANAVSFRRTSTRSNKNSGDVSGRE